VRVLVFGVLLPVSVYVRPCLLEVYRRRTTWLDLDLPKIWPKACQLLNVPLCYLGVMSARPTALPWRGPDLASAAARKRQSTWTSWK